MTILDAPYLYVTWCNTCIYHKLSIVNRVSKTLLVIHSYCLTMSGACRSVEASMGSGIECCFTTLVLPMETCILRSLAEAVLSLIECSVLLQGSKL